jgi:GNAT superfamily N-acetyltransferase
MSNEPAMRVRPATSGDEAAIVALSASVQARLTASGSLQQFGPIPAATVAAHVAAGSSLVLDDGAALLGGVFIEPEFAPATPDLPSIFAKLSLPAAAAPRWWLQKLMIAPERQGGGLGVLLLNAAKERVAGCGGGTIMLDCWAGNTKLRAFYSAAGFRFHGEFIEEDFAVAAFTWTA